MKKRIVVVCPGRGSYTKETLGYLRSHGGKQQEFLQHIDEMRRRWHEPLISDLDQAASFKVSLHTKGEHASPLIYACAQVDFQAINRDNYEIVAICGNSMGWYLSLAMGQVLDVDGAFHLIQTMGSMMKQGLVGGQVIYSVTHDDWSASSDYEAEAMVIAEACGAELSIRLGGYLVFGGPNEALKALLDQLPKRGDTPFQLVNHGAFHTSLMADISRKAFAAIHLDLFKPPAIPLIDGCGRIWQPYSTSLKDL